MVNVIYIAGVFCSWLTAYILLFRVKAQQVYSSLLLAFGLLSSSLCVVGYLVLVNGWFIQLPHLYKGAVPLNFVYPPLFYLYFRYLILDEQRFHPRDFWHLFPFLLVFVNYIPLYFMDTEVKRELVRKVTEDITGNYMNTNGFVPEVAIHIFGFFQRSFYLILEWQLFFRLKDHLLNARFPNQEKTIKQWIRSLLLLFTVLFLGTLLYLLIVNFSGFFKSLHTDSLVLGTGIVMSVSFLWISSYLLIHPEILFGLPLGLVQPISSILPSEQEKPRRGVATDHFREEIKLIEKFFLESKPYLRQALTINEVAVETAIPARDLSFILNTHYQKRFTEFVNGFRIDFIRVKIESGYLDQFTLETLAREGGFASLSTFNAAFKKINGQTPTDYLKSLNTLK